MDKGTRRNLLIVAIGLVVIAAVWLTALECNSGIRAVCSSINRFGYNVTPNELLLQGYSNNSTIAEVLSKANDVSPDDIELIRGHSIRCGFEAETERVGRVELLLWDMDETRVMYVYTVDGVAQIVFIEDITSKTTAPIG